MNIPKTIIDKIRYRLVLQSISDMLERIGVTAVPYYTFEEFVADKLELDLEPGLSPVAPCFLSHAEIESLCLRPDSGDIKLDKEKLLTDSCQCFALKHNQEIVAYMTCDFRQCDSRLWSFPLKEDEVYLSGMFTFPLYRGKNLAAVLECELYKELQVMGRKKYYSINILFNAPGLDFKRKLKSEPVQLRLYVKLFGKLERNFTLRRYHRQS